MHEKMIDLVARRFQVLGEPCRLRILQALQDRAMTVNQIVDRLGGNQPNISRHLLILFDAGLVARERLGNSILYSIADPVVFKLCALVCDSTARRAASLQNYSRKQTNNRGLQRGTVRMKLAMTRGAN